MYASLDDIKTYLGIALTDDSEDDIVTSLIEAAQSDIDSSCGRSFEASSSTLYYGPESVEGQYLKLDADLLTVTTLLNGDGAEIPADGFILWPRNAVPATRILLKSSYLWSFDTDGEISVAGTWGYTVTAPPLIVQATREYVHYLYYSPDLLKDRKQGAARADMIPDHIVGLLSSVRRRTL